MFEVGKKTDEHTATGVELTSQHAIAEGMEAIAGGDVIGAPDVNVTSKCSARPCAHLFC